MIDDPGITLWIVTNVISAKSANVKSASAKSASTKNTHHNKLAFLPDSQIC